MNLEFEPRFQSASGLLTIVNSLLLLSLGSAFLTFPRLILSELFDCHGNDVHYLRESYDNHKYNISIQDLLHASHHADPISSVTRFMGGLLVAQGLACLMLIYPIVMEGSVKTGPSVAMNQNEFSRFAVWNLRVSISMQLITALHWIVIALYSDRKNEATVASIVSSIEGRETKINNELRSSENGRHVPIDLLLIGFFLLVIGCSSLMLSFWPVTDTGNVSSRNTRNMTAHETTSPHFEVNQDLSEPLLPVHDDNEINVENVQPSPIAEEVEGGCDPVTSNVPDPTTGTQMNDEDVGETENVELSQHDEPTSRIRGTQRLLEVAAPQMIYLYIGCITLLIRLPFSLSIPHFVSTTLGALARTEFDHAKREIIRLFIIGTIDAFLDFWCIFWFGYANQRIVREIRIDTFLSILKQDVGFFDCQTSGELASRLNSDCGEMAGDLTWFFRFSIESVVRITGITAYMLIRCPKLGICAISIVPLVAIVNKYYGDWLSKNAADVQDSLAAANAVAQETLSCIRTVVAFASEELEHKKYTERIDEQYRLNIRQTYIQGVYYMFVSTFLINTVVQGTLLLVGSLMIQREVLTSEILLAFMLYQGQLQNEMMNLFNSYSSLVKSTGAGDKVFDLLDREPPPPGLGSGDVQRLLGSENRTSDESTGIQFENIWFSYPLRPNQLILKGISLTVDAGSTVALVGPSGCGKSTVINLLQRFYDVSTGRILIDGLDIKSFDLRRHRQRIGVVTQDPTLFSGTILSNILYGMSNATLEEAIDAAKSANAHDFISAFPDGYETEVGERGIQLSGGQKQRIAISRAIIRNPSLLLLDEATSALDAESETLVQNSIDNLLSQSKNVTTIIVAHRLRTVRNADCIAVIKDGRIVEVGSHTDLMYLADGYYKGIIDKSMGETISVD